MHAVLGGGISGLSAAYYLLKLSCQGSIPKTKVLVIEGSNRVGGWIQTCKQKNGLIFEQGPRTVRPRFIAGLNTLRLIEELKIDHLVHGIPISHPTAKNRMIYVNGELHTLPSSLGEVFIQKTPFSKPLAAALLHDLKAEKKVLSDESIYSFVERRFGSELADYVISPMICGICAGDAKEISVKFLTTLLPQLEQTYGSVTKGLLALSLHKVWENTRKLWGKEAGEKLEPGSLGYKAKQEHWSVWSLKGGLEVLPQTLLKSIQSQGAEVHLDMDCSQILFNGESVQLYTKSGKLEARHVTSTVSAQRLAPLLAKQHPVLSKELSKIPSVTVAVVNLAFSGNVLEHNAFGFLVPPSEMRPILGVIFDTCSFPQDNFTVLTVMMGGRWFDSRLGSSASKEHILNVAIREVRSILKISEDPCHHQVSVLQDCIPQYVVGHHDRVERIREYIATHKLPLSLAGSSYDGVGVNDVIYSALQSVQLGVPIQ